MRYEDFEKAQELIDEINNLADVAEILAPAEYNEEEPVIICRKIGDMVSPISIPAELARKLSAMVWKLAEEKEKEFDAL